jgi:hypothetical protein
MVDYFEVWRDLVGHEIIYGYVLALAWAFRVEVDEGSDRDNYAFLDLFSNLVSRFIFFYLFMMGLIFFIINRFFMVCL